MLTGVSPFEDSTYVKTLVRVRDHAPPAASRVDRQLCPELSAIVSKAMSRHPPDRFKNVSELGAELQRWIDGLPVQTRPIGPVRRTIRWCRRNPLATAAMIAIATLLGISTVQRRQVDAALRQTQLAKLAAERNGQRASRTARQLAHQLYRSDTTAAAAALAVGNIDQAAALLNRHARDPGRGWDWHLLNQSMRQPRTQFFNEHADVVWQIAVDRTQGQFLTASDDKTIRWWDLQSPTPRRKIKFDDSPRRVIGMVPGGPMLIGDNSLYPAHRKTGRPVGLAIGWQPTGLRAVAVSADGRWAASMAFNSEFQIHDLAVLAGHGEASDLPTAESVIRPIHLRPAFRAYRIDFTPDGQRLLFGYAHDDGRDRLGIWNVPEHRLERSVSLASTQSSNARGVGAVDVAPDGRMAAIAGDRVVHLYDLQTASTAGLIETGTDVMDIEFNEDGSKLLCGLDSGRTAIIGGITHANQHRSIHQKPWRSIEYLSRGASPVRCVAWLDERRVASGHENGEVLVTELPTSDPPMWSSSSRPPFFSNDGTKLFEQIGDDRLVAYELSGNAGPTLRRVGQATFDATMLAGQSTINSRIKSGCRHYDQATNTLYFGVQNQLFAWPLDQDQALADRPA